MTKKPERALTTIVNVGHCHARASASTDTNHLGKRSSALTFTSKLCNGLSLSPSLHFATLRAVKSELVISSDWEVTSNGWGKKNEERNKSKRCRCCHRRKLWCCFVVVVFLFNQFESMCNLRGVLHIVVLLSKVNTWNRCRCRLASSPSKSKPLGFTRWVENTYSTMIFPL